MIENDTEMRPRQPTYDGSLFGPDACRCGAHVCPHRHLSETDSYAVEVLFADDDEAES